MQYRKMVRVYLCEECNQAKQIVSVFEANEKNMVCASPYGNFWIPIEELEILDEKKYCEAGHEMALNMAASEWID